MGARRLNPRLIKIHRTYTVNEAAESLDVSKGTVRNWIKNGLSLIDSKRPSLILGADLREFLEERAKRRKSPCGHDEFYCLKCRKPQRPAFGMVDYIPITPKGGNLRGICGVCETLMYRRISNRQLNNFNDVFSIQFPEGERSINKGEQPSLNRYFEKDPGP